MTELDRRAVLSFLGLGCAVTPIMTAKALSLPPAVQGADPEVDAVLQEVVRHALRTKRKMARGGAGPRPGDLDFAAGHLRLLDVMSETRGWKRIVRDARFPDDGELHRASGNIGATMAERLTAAGVSTQRRALEMLYSQGRDRLSQRLKAELHRSLHRGTFLADHANGLTVLAEMWRDQGGVMTPAGLIGEAGRKRVQGVLLPVAQDHEPPVGFCEGLQNMSLVLSTTALLLMFVPPLQTLAVIDQLLALLLSWIALFSCD